jgi:hypothetical protein
MTSYPDGVPDLPSEWSDLKHLQSSGKLSDRHQAAVDYAVHVCEICLVVLGRAFNPHERPSWWEHTLRTHMLKGTYPTVQDYKTTGGVGSEPVSQNSK